MGKIFPKDTADKGQIQNTQNPLNVNNNKTNTSIKN